jgi:uncharacterized protein
MLIEFRVANFRSFYKEQTLSLIANNDTSLSDNIVEINRFKLLKAAAIYGPNASGKSNLIKAIAIMLHWIKTSASAKPTDNIPVTPFAFHKDSQNQPSSFSVEFLHDGIRYNYGFSATSKAIIEERLYAFPKQYPQLWFKRELDRKKNKTKWHFGSFLKGDNIKLSKATKDNSLFLSVAAQWNHRQLTEVYKWFVNHLGVILTGGDLTSITAKYFHFEDPKIGESFQKFITNFLNDADLGIKGLKVKKIEFDESSIPETYSKDLKEVIKKNMEDQYRIEMIHHHSNSETDIVFPFEEESDGTKRIFELAGPWLEALSFGITAAVDEIERSLHPMLTRELISLIMDSPNKNKPAQVIFTTHDTTLLRPDLFRRDQIYLIEKNNSGESVLFSIGDYKLSPARKGEALDKSYLSGKFGAIPILDAFKLRKHGIET